MFQDIPQDIHTNKQKPTIDNIVYTIAIYSVAVKTLDGLTADRGLGSGTCSTQH